MENYHMEIIFVKEVKHGFNASIAQVYYQRVFNWCRWKGLDSTEKIPNLALGRPNRQTSRCIDRGWCIYESSHQKEGGQKAARTSFTIVLPVDLSHVHSFLVTLCGFARVMYPERTEELPTDVSCCIPDPRNCRNIKDINNPAVGIFPTYSWVMVCWCHA